MNVNKMKLQFNQSTTIYGSQLIIFGQTVHANNAYQEQVRPFA
jgi:hypothetical protein